MTDEEHPQLVVHAPWTPEQVAALNALQRAGVQQPFMHRTDDHRATLEATRDGWACPMEWCGYVRSWTPHWTLWSLATPGIPYPEPTVPRHEDPHTIGPAGLLARMRARRRAEQEHVAGLERQVAHLEGRVTGLIRHARALDADRTALTARVRELEAHTDATCDAVQERDDLRRALRDTIAMLPGRAGMVA